MNYGPYPGGDALSRRRYLTAPTRHALTTSNTTGTAVLTAGCVYELYSSDCSFYFIQGSASATATTASWYMEQGDIREVYCSGSGDTYIGALVASGTGNLWIGRVE